MTAAPIKTKASTAAVGKAEAETQAKQVQVKDLKKIDTGGPLIGRPLIRRNFLYDSFCLFSKFYNSSHSTAVLLSILIGLFIKKILYFLRPMRGPPVLHT